MSHYKQLPHILVLFSENTRKAIFFDGILKETRLSTEQTEFDGEFRCVGPKEDVHQRGRKRPIHSIIVSWNLLQDVFSGIVSGSALFCLTKYVHGCEGVYEVHYSDASHKPSIPKKVSTRKTCTAWLFDNLQSVKTFNRSVKYALFKASKYQIPILKRVKIQYWPSLKIS